MFKASRSQRSFRRVHRQNLMDERVTVVLGRNSVSANESFGSSVCSVRGR